MKIQKPTHGKPRHSEFYSVSAYFPDIHTLDLKQDLFRAYFNSIKRTIRQKEELSDVEYRCVRALDALYADAQLATNKGQRWAIIRNPAEDSIDTPFDPECWKIIQRELSLVPGLKFKLVNFLVYLWPSTHLSNDPELKEEELPSYLRKSH